ncbi:MAG TPA: FadR/GntR family transcriptional regulator [Thermodesulfobacteriota bacterium]|nr:FadR/GntR family transcriptional regulator [Thermodesulfobacteriota bacterium]
MFDSVKSDKVSQHIIDQIRNAIFDGRLRPGDKLPSEKELTEKFKVSKATLREALRSLEVLGFLQMRKGVSGGAFVTEVDMVKARDSFTNFLLFKNLSLEDLSEVRLLLEPYIAEKATLVIAQEDLRRLEKLIKDSEHAMKNDASLASRVDEIEFHRIIASITGNPILMFILDFVENLLIDTKEILKPGKEFSGKVLRAHKRIYGALLNRNVKKVREEMVKHIREVEKDLIAAHQERHNEKQRVDRIGRQKESIPIFSRRV